MAVQLRRANPSDADFILALNSDEDVRPFLGPRAASDPEMIAEEIERSLAEPDAFGRFVIEVDGERAGALGFRVASERNRIARVERIAVHPRFRGRRVADEAARIFQRLLFDEFDFRRLELEVYAFNERAQAHTERAGYVREGRKRRAYLKDGEWVDSILYALLEEDLA